MELLIIEMAVFAAVSLAMLVAFQLLRRKEAAADDRFASYFGRGPTPAARARAAGSPLARLLSPDRLARLSTHVLPDSDAARSRLQSQLVQAGIYSRSALSTYCVLKLSLMILPPVVGCLVGLAGVGNLNRAVMIGAICGAVGSLLPGIALRYRKTRRQRVFRRSLPDFLDLLVACLEGGVGMQGSFKRVAEELQIAHPQLAGEINIVQREIELGANTERAVRNLAERTDLEEIHLLASFIQQSQRFGSTTADAMRDLSDLLRIQRENRLEEKSHQAAVKMLIPTLLFILPAIFIVLVGPAAIMVKQNLTNKSGKSNKRPAVGRKADRVSVVVTR